MRLTNYAVVMMLCCGPVSAIGDELRLLEGTWVIDTQKTEELLISTSPPANNAEWLPGALLQMCVTTMTFSGDTLTRTGIGPAPVAESFRLMPLSKGTLTYALETKEGKKVDTIAISFLNNAHISIKSARMEFMEYGVWRRGQLSSPQTGEADFVRALDTCNAMLQKLTFRKDR